MTPTNAGFGGNNPFVNDSHHTNEVVDQVIDVIIFLILEIFFRKQISFDELCRFAVSRPDVTHCT